MRAQLIEGDGACELLFELHFHCVPTRLGWVALCIIVIVVAIESGWIRECLLRHDHRADDAGYIAARVIEEDAVIDLHLLDEVACLIVTNPIPQCFLALLTR